MSVTETATCYVIGDFAIEPEVRRLRGLDGAAIHLPKRPFQVLLYLVAHRDRLVTRAELLERFWDGRDVYDAALTRCVSSVRTALGDRGTPARFIETRWAEGYRFIGPCEEHAHPSTPALAALPASAPAAGRSMSETEEALAAAGAIYDAALDPARWPEALERIARFVGGVAAALTSQDVARWQGRFQYSWGDNPHYTRTYFEKYVRLNPCLVPLMLLDAGEVCSASTLMPTEKFRTTRFYDEWARPQGWGDNTAAIIEKGPSVVTFLGVSHRDEDSPVDHAARRRMALLVPHVRRAVAIADLLERRRIEADALAGAVDALAAGVFLINEGAVVHANASGRAMLRDGTMLHLDEGALAASSAADRQALDAAIAEAIDGNVTPGRRGGVPLRAPDGERHVAHVLPLGFGRGRQTRGAAQADAAVFVHRAAIDGPLPLEALAQHFGLSAGELRVLVALLEVGGRVSDIAPVLALSEATVRTHLRRLFAKTGASRQADLVRLVAGYMGPLLPPDSR